MRIRAEWEAARTLSCTGVPNEPVFAVARACGCLFAGQARYARLGEFDGKVEVQLHAADPWSPAERNLPLAESAWLRTGAVLARSKSNSTMAAHGGSGPDSQVEISDYTRLSTGQRITVLSLDRGVAYFTGEPAARTR